MRTKLRIAMVVLFSMVLLTACGGTKVDEVSGAWLNTTSEIVDLSSIDAGDYEVVIESTLTINEDNTLTLAVIWADSSIEEFRTIFNDYFESVMTIATTEEEKTMFKEEFEKQLGCTIDEFIDQQVEAALADSTSEINGTFEIDGESLIVTTDDGEQGLIEYKDGVLESDGLTFERVK